MVDAWLLWAKYLILGLVQGITEPIPISSSGHLVIVRQLFHVRAEGLSFEIFVNFASLLAILLVYRKDLYRLTTHGLRYITTRNHQYKSDFMFILYLGIATLPVGLIGLWWGDAIQEALSNIQVVGVTLLLTAVALYAIRNLEGKKSDHALTTTDAIMVGFAQAVAVTPGISRSGATIVASMLLGMTRETALRFAFLLYIPVSLGTAVLELPAMAQDPAMGNLLVPYMIAFFASFVSSYGALKAFMHLMARGNLIYFVYYCLAAGIGVLLFL